MCGRTGHEEVTKLTSVYEDDVTPLLWPSQSSDSNPVKKPWDILERLVRQCSPPPSKHCKENIFIYKSGVHHPRRVTLICHPSVYSYSEVLVLELSYLCLVFYFATIIRVSLTHFTVATINSHNDANSNAKNECASSTSLVTNVTVVMYVSYITTYQVMTSVQYSLSF